MKLFYISVYLVFLLIQNSVGESLDEFLTLWAPRRAVANEPYNVYFLPSNVDSNTEIAVQFHESFKTKSIVNNDLNRINFDDPAIFGAESSTTLSVTLFQGSNDQCSTREFTIEVEHKIHYIFIQLDKPIHKPGDQVKFRVLVLDRHLKPFSITQLDIKIIDPYDRVIKEFTSTEDVGVFENIFELTHRTILGEWKIKAILDNSLYTTKIFTVQKYILPEFNIYIDVEEEKLQLDSDLNMSFYAKYSFGDLVTGNAKLFIYDLTNSSELHATSFSNITESQQISLNVANDLKITTNSRVDLEALVVFTEPESGLTFNKTAKISIFSELRYYIVVYHSETFQPGQPLTIRIKLYDWKFEDHVKLDEDVRLIYKLTNSNGVTTELTNYIHASNGIIVHEHLIPEDTENIEIECQYIDSNVYRRNIIKGDVNIEVDGLYVDHTPKRPKLNDNVMVTVSGTENMKEIIVDIKNRLRSIEVRRVNCFDRTFCSFSVEITKDLLTHSTILVYYVKDMHNIHKGSTTIVTELLGANHLTMDLSAEQTRTGDNVKMRFSSRKGSKVYLLAFDSRLSYLKDFNDITQDSVLEEVAGYDRENYVYINQLDSWHDCTEDEMNRVINGRSAVTSKAFITAINGLENNENLVSSKRLNVPKSSEIELRENFPETWIFETFEIGNSEKIEREYKVPDTLTSWHVSAFALSEHDGLAIAPSKELPVRNDFFIKMNLPYSIRYKEILRLDILVYNYIHKRQPMDVTLELINLNQKEFNFVTYDEDCQVSYFNDQSSFKNVTVPASSVRRVSFYIQSFPRDSENVANNTDLTEMRFHVVARGRDDCRDLYQDVLMQKLLVLRTGVRIYHVEVVAQSFYNHVVEGSYKPTALTNEYMKLSKTDLTITGDYLSDSFDIKGGFTFFPSECLQQVTSRMKGDIERYRYFVARNITINTNIFNQQYQRILSIKNSYSYASTTGYKMLLVDSIATATKLRVLSSSTTNIITELFDYAVSQQQSSGTFNNFGTLVSFSGTTKTILHMETAYVMTSFLKHRDITTKNYENVIKKSMDYLNNQTNLAGVANNGLSITAFANALNGHKVLAEKLLSQVEDAKIVYLNNRICYKIKTADSSCDSLHTIHTALAYTKLGNIAAAKPIVNWIVGQHQAAIGNSYILLMGFAAEPIAELMMMIDPVNIKLSVELTDDLNRHDVLEITNQNSHNENEFEFSEHVGQINYKVSGQGFCSLRFITELIQTVNHIADSFELDIQTNVPSIANQRVVTVCATFTPVDAKSNRTIVNVIYEVEFPSGYAYVDVMNRTAVFQNVRDITPERQDTVVILYYEDFVPYKQYCVNIIARKEFQVNQMEKAGVKVYDYDNKSQVSAGFYDFLNEQC